MAIQAFSRINKKCDVQYHPCVFFASPTIAQLAEVIGSAQNSAHSEIERLPSQDYDHLSDVKKGSG